MIPTSHIATAVRDLGETGRAITAIRQRAITAPLAAYEVVSRPSRTARALVAMVSPVPPEIQVPHHG